MLSHLVRRFSSVSPKHCVQIFWIALQMIYAVFSIFKKVVLVVKSIQAACMDREILTVHLVLGNSTAHLVLFFFFIGKMFNLSCVCECPNRHTLVFDTLDFPFFVCVFLLHVKCDWFIAALSFSSHFLFILLDFLHHGMVCDWEECLCRVL